MQAVADAAADVVAAPIGFGQSKMGRRCNYSSVDPTHGSSSHFLSWSRYPARDPYLLDGPCGMPLYFFIGGACGLKQQNWLIKAGR